MLNKSSGSRSCHNLESVVRVVLYNVIHVSQVLSDTTAGVWLDRTGLILMLKNVHPVPGSYSPSAWF